MKRLIKIIRKNPLFYIFLFPSLIDCLLTILGQNASFWINPKMASEGSPAYFLLSCSPWLFATAFLIWLFVWFWLLQRLNEPLNLVLTITLLIGHSWGSGNWLGIIFVKINPDLPFLIITKWIVSILYFLIIACFATYCLKAYIKATIKRQSSV